MKGDEPSGSRCEKRIRIASSSERARALLFNQKGAKYSIKGKMMR